VIQALSDAGVITFDRLWKRANALPIDEACSVLDGILDLVQHHPALAPEIAAMRTLCDAWWGLIPDWETRRPAGFETQLDLARAQPLPDAVRSLVMIRDRFALIPELAADLARITAIAEAWPALRDNLVSERSDKL
jgi:hypothetical protein